MATTGEILRVVLVYGLPAASAALNVFNWIIDDGNPPDEDVVTDFAFWAENVWGVNWADMAGAGTTIERVEVDVVDTQGHVLRNVGTENIGLAGTVGGEAGVAAASAYVLAGTSIPKTRGSKYIPGLSEGNVTDGFLTAETVADLILILLDYVTRYSGNESNAVYLPGVVSRTSEEFVEFSGSGYFTDVPAYQRRRKPNVGS